MNKYSYADLATIDGRWPVSPAWRNSVRTIAFAGEGVTRDLDSLRFIAHEFPHAVWRVHRASGHEFEEQVIEIANEQGVPVQIYTKDPDEHRNHGFGIAYANCQIRAMQGAELYVLCYGGQKAGRAILAKEMSDQDIRSRHVYVEQEQSFTGFFKKTGIQEYEYVLGNRDERADVDREVNYE